MRNRWEMVIVARYGADGKCSERVSQYSGHGALCWPEERASEALSITVFLKSITKEYYNDYLKCTFNLILLQRNMKVTCY